MRACQRCTCALVEMFTCVHNGADTPSWTPVIAHVDVLTCRAEASSSPAVLFIVSLAQRTCNRGKGGRAGPDSCAAAAPPPPMLMASLRSVINEVSEQETGVGRDTALTHPYPIQTLCLPLPYSRQALPAPAPSHPRQTLYLSPRQSLASLDSIFPQASQLAPPSDYFNMSWALGCRCHQIHSLPLTQRTSPNLDS